MTHDDRRETVSPRCIVGPSLPQQNTSSETEVGVRHSPYIRQCHHGPREVFLNLTHENALRKRHIQLRGSHGRAVHTSKPPLRPVGAFRNLLGISSTKVRARPVILGCNDLDIGLYQLQLAAAVRAAEPSRKQKDEGGGPFKSHTAVLG